MFQQLLQKITKFTWEIDDESIFLAFYPDLLRPLEFIGLTTIFKLHMLMMVSFLLQTPLIKF